MRAKNDSDGGVVDPPAPARPGEPQPDAIGGFLGGLRLRGMISRRMRRALKEELELVTYLVTSENESHRVEELGRPGGPYYGLGNLVDLEVEVRSYLAKDGQVQLTLRSVRYQGEF